jgi:hypothetical protein
MKGPDFIIVGPLRAGTTLFRLMLGNHPSIHDIGEFEESVAMLPDRGYPSHQSYRDWLAVHRVAQSRQYQIPDNALSYQDITEAMWKHNAAKAPAGSIVGCTIHSRIDRVLDLWPETKLICIVRDPRDVCNSCVGMGWYGHPASAYPKWINPTRYWEAARNQLPADRWVQIRYEDLLVRPEEELTKCCRLMGLEYDQRMLNFHESSSYNALDPKLAEQWKRKMDPRTAEIIDWYCASQMGDYGYMPSVQSPRSPSTSERARIRFQNIIGRLSWRIKRYGLPLELSWKIAKRLPITNPWRQKIHNRINQIDQHHLR